MPKKSLIRFLRLAVKPTALLLLGLIFCPPPASGADDRILEDFEGEAFGEWEVEGKDFGSGPSFGPRPKQPKVEGQVGRGFANSYANPQSAANALTSPPFVIDRPYLNFRLGGFEIPGRAGLELLVDGKVVRSATGAGGPRLWLMGWDVRELAGKTAQVWIIDRIADKGPEQFVLVDDIRLSDQPAAQDISLPLSLDGKYLILPLAFTGPSSFFQLEVDGKVVHEANIIRFPREGARPDYTLPIALGDHAGKHGVMRIKDAPAGLDTKLFRVADAFDGEAELYREPNRPQFHFSARRGWLNDPNGLVYDQGVWHLYFQHNAFGSGKMANQSWGHATSTDLFHWKEQPQVLLPFIQAKGKAYSGSAVVDKKNRAGFQRGDHPPIVAAFTDTALGESLASSNDGGQTFAVWEGNPVLKNAGRDPKIFWYPPEDVEQQRGHWVMAVFNSRKGKNSINILVSEDLKQWTHTDTLEGFYECPELVELPVLNAAGESTGKKKWVLWGANARYAVGDFDGRKFQADGRPLLQTHYGRIYASQRWNDAPDGRVVQIFWMRASPPNEPFSQSMSLPLELSLRETPSGPRLLANPVKEFEALRTREHSVAAASLEPGGRLLLGPVGQQFDIEVELSGLGASRVSLEAGRDVVVLDAAQGTLDGHPFPIADGRAKLRLVVDRNTLEVFGNGGEIYVAKRRDADMGKPVQVALRAGETPLQVGRGQAWEIASVWDAP